MLTGFIWYYLIGCVIIGLPIVAAKDTDEGKKAIEEFQDATNGDPLIGIIVLMLVAALWLPIAVYVVMYGKDKDVN